MAKLLVVGFGGAFTGEFFGGKGLELDAVGAGGFGGVNKLYCRFDRAVMVDAGLGDDIGGN